MTIQIDGSKYIEICSEIAGTVSGFKCDIPLQLDAATDVNFCVGPQYGNLLANANRVPMDDVYLIIKLNVVYAKAQRTDGEVDEVIGGVPRNKCVLKNQIITILRHAVLIIRITGSPVIRLTPPKVVRVVRTKKPRHRISGQACPFQGTDKEHVDENHPADNKHGKLAVNVHRLGKGWWFGRGRLAVVARGWRIPTKRLIQSAPRPTTCSLEYSLPSSARSRPAGQEGLPSTIDFKRVGDAARCGDKPTFDELIFMIWLCCCLF